MKFKVFGLFLTCACLFADACCDFTAAADRVMPAMVRVQAKEIDHVTIYNEDPNRKESYASGVSISEEGLILTNYHVICGASKLTVTSFVTHKTYPVVQTWSDPDSDLALLKVDAADLPWVPLGNSDLVRVGEWIGLVGNPLGQKNVLTVGVVSGKEIRDVGICRAEDYIRTNALSLPGNSGGPVFSLSGELVGIHIGHWFYSNDSKIPAGIGFEIPSNQAKHVVEQLLRDGSVKRPYFGASLKFIDKSLAKDLALGEGEALIVLDIEEGSPAWNAGLRRKDAILKCGKVSSLKEFQRELNLYIEPNSQLPLTIFRRGELLDLDVRLGEQMRQEGQSPIELEPFGIYVEDIHAERAEELGHGFGATGVLITKIKKESVASDSGLKPSFLITGIFFDLYNERPVRNLADLIQAMRENDMARPFVLEIRKPYAASPEYTLLKPAS